MAVACLRARPAMLPPAPVSLLPYATWPPKAGARPPPAAVLTVIPTNGPAGNPFQLRLTGAKAEETVTFTVTAPGQGPYERSRGCRIQPRQELSARHRNNTRHGRGHCSPNQERTRHVAHCGQYHYRPKTRRAVQNGGGDGVFRHHGRR
jgi:hypothetical protein